MAHDLGNPFDTTPPSWFFGASFEFQVREHLRTKLPDTYVFRQGIVITEAERQARRETEAIQSGREFRRDYGDNRGKNESRQPLIREIDFVVAGPNGIFFLEVKSFKLIKGPINDLWEWWYVDQRRNELRRLMRHGKPPVEKMQNLMAKFTTLAGASAKNNPGHHFLSGHSRATPIFVFPSDASIEVTPEHGRQPGDYSPFHLVTLDQLAKTILNKPFDARYAKEQMTNEEAQIVIREVLIPGMIEEPSIMGSYEVVERGKEQRADNGLIYTLNLLRHHEMKAQQVWGKRYDTTMLADRDRSMFEQQVKRHALVISGIKHPNIHHYYDSFQDPYDNSYWVLEEWIDGVTLEKLMTRNEAGKLDIGKLMLEIAQGIHALHGKKFIYRDLNPSGIYIEKETNRAVLTNFEMARAPEGPTVSSGEYARDPYRAPEWISEPKSADVRADVYSWGAIFFHLATGETYNETNIQKLISASSLPSETATLVTSCLERDPERRPSEMAEVIKRMKSLS